MKIINSPHKMWMIIVSENKIEVTSYLYWDKKIYWYCVEKLWREK